MMSDVECFNESQIDSVRKVVRPFAEKMAFASNPTLTMTSDLGKDLVVKIQFNAEVKVKAICVAGGYNGTAPSKMKVYKNEETVDFEIIRDKRPLQVIDLAENVQADLDYPVNLSKFNNCNNIVLGFEDNFGAAQTVINFIGLKGLYLRDKSKAQEIVYEVRANIADHRVPGEDEKSRTNIGM